MLLYYNYDNAFGNAPLAQLDKALVYGTKDWEFESLMVRQQFIYPGKSNWSLLVRIQLPGRSIARAPNLA